jgi:hypothetical protein
MADDVSSLASARHEPDPLQSLLSGADRAYPGAICDRCAGPGGLSDAGRDTGASEADRRRLRIRGHQLFREGIPSNSPHEPRRLPASVPKRAASRPTSRTPIWSTLTWIAGAARFRDLRAMNLTAPSEERHSPDVRPFIASNSPCISI